MLINVIFSLLFILLSSSFLLSLCYPAFQKILARFPADVHANSIFAYALIPLLITIIGTLAISVQTSIFHPIFKHCHGDNCSDHAPNINIGQSISITIMLLFLSLAVTIFCIAIVRNRHNRSRLNYLAQLSQADPQNFQILETNKITAFSSGLIQPKIFISTGLINLLTKDELNAVVLHEQAHCFYRDNLRKTVLYWLSLPWLVPQRKQLRESFNLHCELNSDNYAAHNKTSQENLLNAIQKIHQQQPSTLYLKRIHFLQNKSNNNSQLVVAVLLTLISYMLLITLSISYHHLVEWLLA